MKPYMVIMYTIRGGMETKWAVYRSGTEFVFGTYADAEKYAKSWR